MKKPEIGFSETTIVEILLPVLDRKREATKYGNLLLLQLEEKRREGCYLSEGLKDLVVVVM